MPDLSLVRSVCHFAADPGYFTGLHRRLDDRGLVAAVQAHDTPALFAWLVEVFSFQGISDAAALAFMDRHGRASWADVARGLLGQPTCPKLTSHWHFHRCDFTRSRGTCAEPAHYPGCPLPALPMRNGALNRMAHGLFLFIRDVCDGDLVGWIDQRLEAVPDPTSPDYPERLGQAVIGPLRLVFGVSHKVLNMTLADLLIGADPERELWGLAGRHMVAIDTLIHNLLHRTGTLAQCEAQHAYGPACYAPRGCAAIVRHLAHEIDARSFDPSFPAVFPRFVQHALWRYCAQDGLNICNGNQVEDSRTCENESCPVFAACARVPLRPVRLSDAA